jgi:Kef-type K+ transport system membrane component KefB
MTALLSLVLLVFIAYLGSIFFQKVKISKPWIKCLACTGSLYLLLGYLIGPNLFNVFNKEISQQLNVLYALVLGWIGFLIGLQANVKSIKRFQKEYFRFATINIIIALVISFIALYQSFHLLDRFFNETEIFILAIAGAVTSPIMIAVISREYKLSGRVSYLLQFAAAFDNMLGIILVGLVMSYTNDISFLNIYNPGVLIIFVSIIIGTIASYLFCLLSRDMKTDQEIFLLVLGLLLFIVGIAFYLKQSLLFISFVFGFGIANLPVNAKKIYLSIQQVERPLYILLLIFVGANLKFESKEYWFYLAVFMAVNLFAKMISGYFANFSMSQNSRIHKTIGMANLSMGGLSLAIILDFHLTNVSGYSQLLLFILAVSLVINDIISFKYLEKKIVQSEIKV